MSLVDSSRTAPAASPKGSRQRKHTKRPRRPPPEQVYRLDDDDENEGTAQLPAADMVVVGRTTSRFIEGEPSTSPPPLAMLDGPPKPTKKHTARAVRPSMETPSLACAAGPEEQYVDQYRYSAQDQSSQQQSQQYRYPPDAAPAVTMPRAARSQPARSKSARSRPPPSQPPPSRPARPAARTRTDSSSSDASGFSTNSASSGYDYDSPATADDPDEASATPPLAHDEHEHKQGPDRPSQPRRHAAKQTLPPPASAAPKTSFSEILEDTWVFDPTIYENYDEEDLEYDENGRRIQRHRHRHREAQHGTLQRTKAERFRALFQRSSKGASGVE